MSVFVCSKELCVNIFFDCCKVLAAPLKRTFPPFFKNRMYLLKRQSRNKNVFLTQLASQNSVYSFGRKVYFATSFHHRCENIYSTSLGRTLHGQHFRQKNPSCIPFKRTNKSPFPSFFLYGRSAGFTCRIMNHCF